MNLNELEAIALVNAYKRYGRAAKEAGVSASTLSKRVSRVEEELGVKLFNRMSLNSNVVLSEAGELLVPLIIKLLDTNRFMLDHVASVKGGGSDKIAVGSTATLVDKGDGILISSFLHDHPNVEMSTLVGSNREITGYLSEGRIDCAFLMMSGEESSLTDMWETFSGGRFESIVLKYSSSMYVLLSKNDPLSVKYEVSISDLRHHRFIFNETVKTSNVSNAAENFFTELGLDADDFDVTFESFLNQVYAFDLVRIGAGVIPQAFKVSEDIPGLRYVSLKEWKGTTSTLFVVRKFRSGSLDAFAKYVEAHAKPSFYDDYPDYYILQASDMF